MRDDRKENTVKQPEEDQLSSGLVIAIDGPSGSGKSTVSKAVAQALQLAYLDTGAMYRAATWWCLERGVDLEDQQLVADLIVELPLDIRVDPTNPGIIVDGRDVSEAIRESRISRAVSSVATNLSARAELVRQQQQWVNKGRDKELPVGGIIAEGRDITTVIAPDADVRILLTASEDARLARRAQEVHGTVGADTLAATQDEVLRRDRDDSTVANFLKASTGVLTLDNSQQTPEESVTWVISAAKQARPDIFLNRQPLGNDRNAVKD